MSENPTPPVHTNYQHQIALARLTSLHLTLLVLIRILKMPEQEYPRDAIENVLIKLSDALDIVLNPLE